MGQFIRVNGDYNIQTIESGTIKLDTGPGVGTVVVTGNLQVEGTAVTVDVADLSIEDNIITLNKNEAGNGVTLIYSGIKVDRGPDTDNYPPSAFVFNENIDAWQIAFGDDGSYSFANSKLKLKEILTESTQDGGDLFLIGAGTGVLTVTGTAHYEDQVTDDDDIPNKKYVDDAIRDNPTFQVLDNDTRVIVSDKEVAGSLSYLFDNTGYTTVEDDSAVSIIVDGGLSAQFYNNRIESGNLELGGGEERNEITSRNGITNLNVIVRTQGTGKLETNYALELDQIAVTPAFVPNSTIVYSADPEIGQSGLWFVNDSPVVNRRSGEFISKNKALIFSMLF